MLNFRLTAAAGCLATALAATAAPAQADTGAAVSSSAATQAATPQQADRARAEEPVICARIEVPARRVRPRICKTRTQWEREYGGLPTR